MTKNWQCNDMIKWKISLKSRDVLRRLGKSAIYPQRNVLLEFFKQYNLAGREQEREEDIVLFLCLSFAFLHHDQLFLFCIMIKHMIHELISLLLGLTCIMIIHSNVLQGSFSSFKVTHAIDSLYFMANVMFPPLIIETTWKLEEKQAKVTR